MAHQFTISDNTYTTIATFAFGASQVQEEAVNNPLIRKVSFDHA